MLILGDRFTLKKNKATRGVYSFDRHIIPHLPAVMPALSPDLRARFRAIRFTLQRFPMLGWLLGHPPNAITFLYPHNDQQAAVDGWAQFLLTADYLELARRCKVIQLVHLKSVAGFRHEYLKIVMQVGLDGSTRTVVVIIDRNPGEFPPNEDSHHTNTSSTAGTLSSAGTSIHNSQLPDKTTSRNKTKLKFKSTSSASVASSSTTSSQSSTKSGRSATDRVVIPAYGDESRIPDLLKDKVEEVRTLTLPQDTTFPLAHLAALLPVITAYKNQYDALRSQCYWYILAVYTAVFERWPHSDEMVGDAYRDRGRLLGFGVMTSLQPKHAKDIRTKWDEVIKELDNAKSVDQVSLFLRRSSSS
jgi:hypothetical protein